MIRINLQQEDFDPAAELARLEPLGGGAVVSFTGVVRDDGAMAALQIDHYRDMALAHLTALAGTAQQRWPLHGITLIHRHGRLAPGARIMFAGVASAHRADAIDALTMLVDTLKTDAPFWKKQLFLDGREFWIEPQPRDHIARERWR